MKKIKTIYPYNNIFKKTVVNKELEVVKFVPVEEILKLHYHCKTAASISNTVIPSLIINQPHLIKGTLNKNNLP